MRDKRISFKKLAYDNYMKKIKPNINELEKYRKKTYRNFQLISYFWCYIPMIIYTFLLNYYYFAPIFQKDIVLIPWLIAIALNLFPLHFLRGENRKLWLLFYIPYGIFLIIILNHIYTYFAKSFAQDSSNNFVTYFLFSSITLLILSPILYMLSKNQMNTQFNNEIKQQELFKKLIENLDIEFYPNKGAGYGLYNNNNKYFVKDNNTYYYSPVLYNNNITVKTF